MTARPQWQDDLAVTFLWGVEFAALGVVLAVGVVAILNPWLLPLLELKKETT